MANIRVTCNKCHTRFNVSEKFAGKEGPCPKCKTIIRVPKKSDEIKIEAPKNKGPTDTKGQAIVKPITRKDTVLSGVQIALIIASIVGFLAVSIVVNFMVADKAAMSMWIILGVGAFILAIPLVLVSYAFLRDQEREGFLGQSLYGRVGVCSLAFAVAWLALPIAAYAFNDSYEIGSYVVAAVAMFAIGTVASMACFEFEAIMGMVHYGLYLGIALLGRWLAGIGIFPITPPRIGPGVRPATTQLLDTVAENWHSLECLLQTIWL
jgi:hypothetical protein